MSQEVETTPVASTKTDETRNEDVTGGANSPFTDISASKEKWQQDNISENNPTVIKAPQLIRKIDITKEIEALSLEGSCKNMVEKVAEYLNGEFTATAEDYKLLETLNRLTIDKYEEMSSSTNTLITNMEEINEKYKKLEVYLTQVDLLEESVLKLEQTAYKLDTYSKQLGIYHAIFVRSFIEHMSKSVECIFKNK